MEKHTTGTRSATSSRPHARRNSAWIKREYNDEKWTLMHDILGTLLARGEMSLSRLLRLAVGAARSSPTTARISEVDRSARNRLDDLRLLACVINGRPIELPAALAWEAYDGGSASILLDRCPDDADAIVELGSGWGFRLVDLWLRGAPRTAAYFGCEFTDMGLACHELLARVEKSFNLAAMRFDYHHPNLHAVAGRFKNVFVFTHTSIEQIPELKGEVLHQIIALAPKVTVAHLEPVGWQINAARKIVGETGSSRAYAEANDYNRNFWSVLTKMNDQGYLKIGDVKIDLLGINPKNTLSLVTWTRE